MHAPQAAPPAPYLMAWLAYAEALFEQLVPAKTVDVERARQVALAEEHAARRAGARLPDLELAERWGLDALARELLWTVVAPVIDPAIATLVRRLDGAGREGVDAALVMRAVGRDRAGRLAAAAALDAGAPLRRAGAIRVVPGDRLGGRELVPAGWLPAALRGVRAVGPRLEPVATVVTPAIGPDDVPLPPAARELPPLLAGFFRPAGHDPNAGVEGLDHPRGIAVLVHGAAGSGRGVLLRATARELGRRLLIVDGPRLRNAGAAAADVLDAACAEAAALGEILVVRAADELVAPGGAVAAALAQAIAAHRVAAVLVTLTEGPLATEIDALVVYRHRHELAPQAVDVAHLWLLNLPPDTVLDAELDLDRFGHSLNLTPVQVRGAARAVSLIAGTRPVTERDLHAAARGQLAHGIGRLAEVQEVVVGLADLVLPPDQLAQVEEIIAAARNRDVVLRDWGLRRTVKRGLSISCLFEGDPGTGKTLAAEVIASELGLQLLRIDVSSIVDKFIGETEKNLTRVFAQARPDTTLLLFDEADALFTKRTEVQHAVDRYSNMDVNVLLQQLERFEGTAVLTTNLRRSIDPAFERRIMFKVRFERPDVAQRRRIWERMLPPSIPTGERLDFDRLARLDLSGGEIKNAVLRAAFAAASAGTRIAMQHLTAAAHEEAASTGRLYVDVSGRP